jgi:molecular chaperone HscA
VKIPINIKSGEIAREELENKNIIIGIDLGTTNSLVAFINAEGNAQALKSIHGRTIVPSVIHFAENGEVIVGESAKQFLVSDPGNTIYSVKRLLGKSYKDLINKNVKLGFEIIDTDDEYSLVKIRVRDRFYSPIELSSLILKELKSIAEDHLKVTITQAVITVPAYFNDSQRQATRDAGKLAGLDVLRIINEPTAASLSYGIGASREEKKNIAVYDLGGGTFDVSVLTIEEGIFEVLATNGDSFLGGDDIDALILQYLSQKYAIDIADTAAYQALRLYAEEAKKSLSFAPNYEGQYNDQKLTLTVEELNKLLEPLADKTIAYCQQAMKDAKLEFNELDAVVMVGGSTRIPYIKDRVAKFFNQKVNDSLDPDEVVALGAAVQADILAGNRKDLLLLDVTPLSLGVETLGGLMDVIIPRNSKVPSRAGRNYTTSVDGQKNLMVNIFQGERDLVQHNRKLGSFILKNIPPMPAGIPKIEITFMLDADSILIVRAKELRSEVVTEVEIKSAYGISEEEMGMMLLDSIKNAKDDMAIKSLVEAQNEASSIVLATEKFLVNNRDIISDEEYDTLVNLKEVLKVSINTAAKDDINKAMEALNEYANPLAHRSMDRVILESMKGTKLS